MAKINRMDNANYEGMHPSKWPNVSEADAALYERLYSSIQSLPGLSRRERAGAHRLVHYMLRG